MSQTKAQLIEGSAASELTAAKTLLGAGSAGAPSLTATGDTNTGIFFPTADTIAFAEGGVETVRIDSSGRVGIGNSSPAEAKLCVNGGISIEGVYSNYKANILTFDNNVGNSRINSFGPNITTPGSFDFIGYSSNASVGTTRMFISSAGLVGIGTTSPGVSLEVAGPTGDNLIATFRSGDATAANNAGGGFRSISSATATSRIAQVWLDADGANLSGGDYFIIQKNGNSGTVEFNQFASAAMTFKTGDTERARIDSSGRLLVGTTSNTASNTATFQGNSAAATGGSIIQLRRGEANPGAFDLGTIQFADSAGGIAATILGSGDGTWGSNDYPGRLVFSTTADGASSPTERLRITSGGSVCIGSANSQTSRLSLEGSSEAFYNAVFHDTRTGAVSAGQILFKRNTATVGSISTTDVATAYNTSSDYRLKENVTPVTEGITRLQQLKPSRFNFIRNPDATVDGFLAHEVQTVVPEAISGEKDAVDDDGNPIYQGIDQSKLVPLLTAALQEAIGEIESLKARVAALESA